MLRWFAPIAAVALVFVMQRAVAEQCGRFPARRPWFIAGAVALLGLAGLLVPWVLAKLRPPVSESPAGIFVILGKVVIVGSLALAATGMLIGALVRRGPGRPEHDA